MTDTFKIRADILSEPLPPAYRAVLLAKSGTFISACRLPAENDDEALERAKAMVDGHAVDLWDGLRFIEHFPPVD